MYRLLLSLAFSIPLLAQVDFATSIHPILVTRCAPCHSGPTPQAGFSVESRESILRAIKPSKPDESELLRRVKAGEMPASGEKLTASQIALLENWIAEGAPWTSTAPTSPSEWISPIKPRTPPLPANPAANPIDKFLDPHGDVIEDALFIRRATLDIWGMVPSAEATAKFIANPDREQLIDSLLRDKRKYA